MRDDAAVPQPEHSHDHGHAHAPAGFGAAFAVGVLLNGGFVVVEVVCGLFAHSLALVADAGHNLSDVLGLVLAWSATAWARRPPTPSHTYGWRRTSIFAALANAAFLFASVGVIAWEAVCRLIAPAPVAAGTMIWVSAVGIVVNASTAAMFLAGRKGDLNIKAAFQHMAADALISAGVVAAGIGIAFTGWLWLDPAASLALSVAIVAGTWGLLRDATGLALDAVPRGIDLENVRRYLATVPGVIDLHHLHIWALGTTDVALTVHLVVAEGAVSNALLSVINRELEARFGIAHATIQFESPGPPVCESRGC